MQTITASPGTRKRGMTCAALALSFLAIAAWPAWPQTTPPKAPAAAGGTPGAADASGGMGFSIESEMLSYRALESNSEAVACDVAAYLTGGTAKSSKTGNCAVEGGTAPKGGVVLVPLDGASTMDDFRLWRADMEIMAGLNFRVGLYCPDLDTMFRYRGTGTGTSTSTSTTSSTTPSTPGMEVFTPLGSALTLTQTALGLLSSQTTTSVVGGTIHDQAYMNGVARELRRFGVNVLMPSTYVPNSLTADLSHSPFLTNLERLLRGHVCLKDMEPKASGPDKGNIQQIASDIKTFVEALRGPASPAAPQGNANNPGAQANASAASPSGLTVLAAASASSPLLSVLTADDIVQKLDLDFEKGKVKPDGPWRHILMVKALESGGTVERKTYILGTKIRYSGGSVGTYSLFTVEGEVECSGNVYAYGGSLPSKDFEAELRRFMPDTVNQFIFKRGGCK